MTDHKIATPEEWYDARERLLLREKEHTRLGDELAQQPPRAAVGARREGLSLRRRRR